MDCLFNKQIPQSTNTIHVIRPDGNNQKPKPQSFLFLLSSTIGKTFVSGLACRYRSDSYDSEKLKDYISDMEYYTMME